MIENLALWSKREPIARYLCEEDGYWFTRYGITSIGDCPLAECSRCEIEWPTCALIEKIAAGCLCPLCAHDRELELAPLQVAILHSRQPCCFCALDPADLIDRARRLGGDLIVHQI